MASGPGYKRHLEHHVELEHGPSRVQVIFDTAENAVWSYEQPYDEVAAIKERVAFYADKVDAINVI